jgi:hypothetical protein
MAVQTDRLIWLAATPTALRARVEFARDRRAVEQPHRAGEIVAVASAGGAAWMVTQCQAAPSDHFQSPLLGNGGQRTVNRSREPAVPAMRLAYPTVMRPWGRW